MKQPGMSAFKREALSVENLLLQNQLRMCVAGN